MKFCLVNHSVMFLILLQYFFRLHIPNHHKPIITWNHILSNRWKLAASHPILMFFILSLQSPIYGRPDFNNLIIASWNQQIPITRIINRSNFGVVSFLNRHIFYLIIHLPKLYHSRGVWRCYDIAIRMYF
jgi:hypothetical protein